MSQVVDDILDISATTEELVSRQPSGLLYILSTEQGAIPLDHPFSLQTFAKDGNSVDLDSICIYKLYSAQLH